MYLIQLSFQFNDNLVLKSVEIDYNDTGLENNSGTLKRVAITLLKAIEINKDSVAVQDLLSELGIKRSSSNNAL